MKSQTCSLRAGIAAISLFVPFCAQAVEDWLAGVQNFAEVRAGLDHQPKLDGVSSERLDIAACLSVVAQVKQAARNRHQGQAGAKLSMPGIDFYINRAIGFEARRNTLGESASDKEIARYWNWLENNPKGWELREAMMNMLGGGKQRAQDCIAMPALVRRLELRKETGQTADETFLAKGNVCAVSAPAALLPYRRRPAIGFTGAELIYWGGRLDNDDRDSLDIGYIYDLAGDSWSLMPQSGSIPSPRWNAYAFATGNGFIVYGGTDAETFANSVLTTGGVYNLTTGAWTAMSTTNAPNVNGATVVWTGTELILWGGVESDSGDFNTVNTGARYDPAGNSWTPTSTTGAPSPRSNHTATWTGTEMLVYGGSAGGRKVDGGIYNPATDTWTAMATPATGNATPRSRHEAVWAASRGELLVWGGQNDAFEPIDDGLIYDRSANSWSDFQNNTLPPPERFGHAAVWTGSEMLIQGGLADVFGNGGTAIVVGGSAFDPATQEWSIMGQFSDHGRAEMFFTWTGSEMLVFYSNFSSVLDPGELYDPVTETWAEMSNSVVPGDADGVLAHWTYDEFSVGQTLPAFQRVLDSCQDRDAAVTDGSPAVIDGPLTGSRAFAYDGDDAVEFVPGFLFSDGPPPAGSDFDFTFDDSFTLEAIIRIPDGSTQVGSIVAKDVGPGQPSWWFRVNNGVMQGLVGESGGSSALSGTVAVNDGAWHHVAFVRDAVDRELRLYVDFELDATTADLTTGDSTTPAGDNVVMGNFNDRNRPLTGDIDQVRVSRGDLASSQFVLVDQVSNIRVSVDDGGAVTMPGGTVTYTITVTNPGPAATTGVAVEALLPMAYTSATWSCTAGTGASCTASGSDDVIDTVDLPANRSVTYTVEATLASMAEGSVTYEAAITPGNTADFDLDDNTATVSTQSDLIFDDSFEAIPAKTYPDFEFKGH